MNIFICLIIGIVLGLISTYFSNKKAAAKKAVEDKKKAEEMKALVSEVVNEIKQESSDIEEN